MSKFFYLDSLNEKQKEAMIKIGCEIGQGFLMHKPEFLDTFKPVGNTDG